MIEFATATFTLKDLAQFAGMAISLGGIVWFLARRLGAIESTLVKVEERQQNYIVVSNRYMRERLAKLETGKSK